MLFSRKLGRPLVFGMVHLQALPGTPNCRSSLDIVEQFALDEAKTYADAEVDGILVENMHDLPYVRHAGPEIVSAFTRICCAIRRAVPDRIALGLQVLAGCNKEALAIASASGFHFLRAEGYVFAHVGDEGMFQSCAGDLKRYQKLIGAESVRIFADIKKKHSSHAITADVSLEETAKAAEFFLSDGVVITGAATGQPPNPQMVEKVKQSVDIPVLIGSGVNADNFAAFSRAGADAFIIGSYFKENNHWANKLDEAKVKTFMDLINRHSL